MVKGVSKRVIVVKAPLNNIFEEAIFVIKDSALPQTSVNSERIIHEACMVANAYVKKHCKATRQVLGVSVSAFAAAGAALTGIAWFLYVMVK
jgi:hypothetical protein